MIQELAGLIDTLKTKNIRLDNKLTKAVEEMNAVNQMMNKGAKEITISDYVAYVLASTDSRKKGQILRYLTGKLTLLEGRVHYAKLA